jgi:D-glycero-D-manno-heptose 1,7-bisphosphate phosphatase
MENRKPALFLDRDGVVNKNIGYVSKISNFEFFPEIMEICTLAQNAGLPIVVVTNQSGIGRGYFTEEDFSLLTKWMIEKFKKNKIQISLVLHAPEEHEEKTQILNPGRRKPSPVMFFEAERKLQLDLCRSVMIGDSETDMIAADRAGIENRVLIHGASTNSVATVIVADHKACLSAVSTILFPERE